MKRLPKLEPHEPRRRRTGAGTCDCCRQTFDFCWSCKCGFLICQSCMLDNSWGMTCNNVNWQCPDCGGWNGYGNN